MSRTQQNYDICDAERRSLIVFMQQLHEQIRIYRTSMQEIVRQSKTNINMSDMSDMSDILDIISQANQNISEVDAQMKQNLIPNL